MTSLYFSGSTAKCLPKRDTSPEKCVVFLTPSACDESGICYWHKVTKASAEKQKHLSMSAVPAQGGDAPLVPNTTGGKMSIRVRSMSGGTDDMSGEEKESTSGEKRTLANTPRRGQRDRWIVLEVNSLSELESADGLDTVHYYLTGDGHRGTFAWINEHTEGHFTKLMNAGKLFMYVERFPEDVSAESIPAEMYSKFKKVFDDGHVFGYDIPFFHQISKIVDSELGDLFEELYLLDRHNISPANLMKVGLLTRKLYNALQHLIDSGIFTPHWVVVGTNKIGMILREYWDPIMHQANMIQQNPPPSSRVPSFFRSKPKPKAIARDLRMEAFFRQVITDLFRQPARSRHSAELQNALAQSIMRKIQEWDVAGASHLISVGGMHLIVENHLFKYMDIKSEGVVDYISLYDGGAKPAI